MNSLSSTRFFRLLFLQCQRFPPRTVFCSSYFHFSHYIHLILPYKYSTYSYCIPPHQLVLDVYEYIAYLEWYLSFFILENTALPVITNVSSFLVFKCRAQALILICFGYRLTSTACTLTLRCVFHRFSLAIIIDNHSYD
jgi:hypothetical protein